MLTYTIKDKCPSPDFKRQSQRRLDVKEYVGGDYEVKIDLTTKRLGIGAPNFDRFTKREFTKEQERQQQLKTRFSRINSRPLTRLSRFKQLSRTSYGQINRRPSRDILDAL